MGFLLRKVKALNETEKLKAAADAYKKDLLAQKLAEREFELSQARDQLRDAEDENAGEGVGVLLGAARLGMQAWCLRMA